MSFDIFETFATDENLENNGVIVPVGKGKASTLLIARSGNRAYAKAVTKAVEKRQVELDGEDDAAAAVSDEIMIAVMAETILLGWTALTFKGEDMGGYTFEKAKKLLGVKDFRKFVAKHSDNFEAYKVKAEVAAGNG